MHSPLVKGTHTDTQSAADFQDRNKERTKRPDSSALVRYGRGDDVTVRPVPAELVFAHHGHGHFVPRLVFADHGAYGEGSVLDQSDLSPAGENPAAPVLFHRHVNPAETEGENQIPR